MCLCVRESEPDDGWSLLTCAAQWTVRLDMAGLSPSLSLTLCFTSSLLHFLRAKHVMSPLLTHSPYFCLSCRLFIWVPM